MFKHLYAKIIVLYLVFMVLSFATVGTFINNKTKQAMEEEEAYHLHVQATSIASSYAARYYTQTLTIETLNNILSLTAADLTADIWIVNADGTIITTAITSGTKAPVSISNFNMLTFGPNFHQVGTFYDYFSTEYLSVYAPITSNYHVVGYVLIHEPVENYESLINSSVNVTYLSMLILFLFALIPLIGFYWIVIRPIKKLKTISLEYNRENFKPQPLNPSRDEIGYIANTMSVMANKIDTNEDVQRKFISNISHDFRSPLTSIRGYLEAMTDGTIPVELYPKYLNIILNETERLTKLTNNLLDLNKIGSKGAFLEYSEFDINEIIRKCALSCEGQCEKKGLTINLDLYEGSTFVHADESKIQQVIYNLLDNAIKFSKPSTSIDIETNRKNDRLMVSIHDHGIGIPKDALDDIWNRFYKSDLSRGKDKKGTGLGLSIVKEIIQAHEQSINVVSTVDVGTEFIFTLELSEKELENDIV